MSRGVTRSARYYAQRSTESVHEARCDAGVRVAVAEVRDNTVRVRRYPWGQYTNVALYGSEQRYLGGMDTIRGFRSAEIAGDRGFCLCNELAWVNVPTWKSG
ncbi:ShlB/FhaC/HecB family hemolysin secretion/activation protein [Burkholderia territorii]|uniref:ShlB/FhaC/HecB family hemolysin secretion/activation protein n=1 Tax=Burkholderia territorii TaxID=1503055 RepID=UPI0039BEF368